MACQKCKSNKSTACGCNDTSYTIPADCTYGGQNCNLPAEPCESVVCTECVRHCHEEDKWCITMQINDSADVGDLTESTSVEICMNKGERLDQFLQKIALAHADASAYPYTVKNFYANNVTSNSVQLIYYDFLYAPLENETLSSMNLFYSAVGSGIWQEIPQFNSLINPLISNTFTVTGDMIPLIPGNTYMFKLTTMYLVDSDGDGSGDTPFTVDPGSAVLYITIPE
jgi:hypothetical protein